MGGRNYTIRVTSDRRYAYASAGLFHSHPDRYRVWCLDLGLIVGNLGQPCNGLMGSRLSRVGNVIKIIRDDGRDFNVSARGGTVNNAMTAIKGQARDVADLPDQCFDQYVLKVNNTDDSDADDYYVKFNPGPRYPRCRLHGKSVWPLALRPPSTPPPCPTPLCVRLMDRSPWML